MFRIHRLFAQGLAAVGALGVFGLGSSDAQGTGPFRSAADAQAYLEQNPTGPLADEAFRYLVYQSLQAEYPEFDGNLGIARSLPAGSTLLTETQGQQPQTRQPVEQGNDDNDDDDDKTY